MKRYGKRVEDMLRQFEKKAHGMINLHVIDPAPYSEEAYKAGLFGLDDKQGFLGLIGTRAGQGAQRIDVFSPEEDPLLEYEVSHLIYKLMHPEPPTLGLLSGLALHQSATQVLEQIHRHFKPVELASNTEQVPESIRTLMVVHPRALPEQALYAIEQFVLRGGKVMIFVDPLSEMKADADPTDSKLDGLLAAWGIQIPSDKLLVDSLYASSAISDGADTVKHPARLTLPRQAMPTNDVSTWKVNTVTVSSSGALSRLRKSRTTLTPLLQSSRQAVLMDENRFASTATFDSPIIEPATPSQQQVIAARIEGPAYSAFPDGIKGQPPGLQKAAHIQIVLVADTDLLSDAVIDSTPNSNLAFVLNILDNMTAPDALASIQPREMLSLAPTPLQHLRDAAAQAYAQKAGELERRLERTEQAWQQLHPQSAGFGSQAVNTNTQLQALNKERLRLPIELHALKAQAYAPVRQVELGLKLFMILTVPLLLCLVAWALALYQRRRRSVPTSGFE